MMSLLSRLFGAPLYPPLHPEIDRQLAARLASLDREIAKLAESNVHYQMENANITELREKLRGLVDGMQNDGEGRDD